MLFNKGLQTLWLGGAAGKVKLVQGFDDPGIDREGFREAVGKQQVAIGNLGPDAGERWAGYVRSMLSSNEFLFVD